MAKTSYAIGLGSNRRGRSGGPERNVRAACQCLDRIGRVLALSRILRTPALGPAGRGFANAALLIETDLDPDALLAELKGIEQAFGRRGGRRWGPRVLDLDILLWSQGAFAGGGLVVPHPQMRRRTFVLGPLADIAPDWRDPISGLTVRQLLFRLRRPRRTSERRREGKPGAATRSGDAR